MQKKIRVAVLISGRGSNMMALIDACSKLNFPAEIAIVISNKTNAEGLKYASKLNIPTITIENNKNNIINESSRLEYDKIIDKEINKYNIDLICLAGFMRILSTWFVNKWKNRIINIHPSLLPNFKGAHAVRDALEANAIESGCTTHFVVAEVDSGSIIMQSKVNIDKNDNHESLAQKILIKEHEIYPKTLEFISNKILNNEL